MSDNAGVPIRSTTASGVGASQGWKVYESSKAVDEYLQFHFASESDLIPLKCTIPREALNFPARLAELCDKYASKNDGSKRYDN